MTFDLELTITGVCAFVPLGANDGYCVVMPSTKTDRLAVDGEQLCPHHSYIEQQGLGFGVARKDLTGQRMWFKLPGATPVLSLQKATNADAGLAHIDDAFYPTKGDTDSDIIFKAPPPPHINALVFLEHGDPDYRTHDRWYFTEENKTYRLVHQLVIRVNGLTQATAVLQPLSSSGYDDLTCIDLTPTASKVKLMIVNTCQRPGLPPKRSMIDRDFKWYYELLTNRPNPDTCYTDLIVPRRRTYHMTQGNNCIPALLNSVAKTPSPAAKDS